MIEKEAEADEVLLGVLAKLIGLGEGADDLAPIDAAGFVDALLTSEAMAF